VTRQDITEGKLDPRWAAANVFTRRAVPRAGW
jgi:hypothetical protein